MKPTPHNQTPFAHRDTDYPQGYLDSRRASRQEIRENRALAVGVATIALMGAGAVYALGHGHGGENPTVRAQQIDNAAKAAWAQGHELPKELPPAPEK